MSNFFEVSAALEKIIFGSAVLAEKMQFNEVSRTIQSQLTEFKNRELMVVVCGEARRGKSSLLNALLDLQDPLFPVDINVCTNVVTVIRYGETEEIQAVLDDPKSPNGIRTERVQKSQIANYVSESGNPNNYKKVRTLEAKVPCPLLKGGLVFVDTPGVGSLNVEHAEAAFSYLPYADLLVFAASSSAPMTESELAFLKRGYKYCQSVIYPLTMIDLNAEYHVILEDNRKKISDALSIAQSDVEIIPVSSAQKLRYLKTGRQMLYRHSNFGNFEKALWSAVTKRRGNLLILPYVSSVEEELHKIADSIAAQYQVLGNSTAAEELEENLKLQIAKLDHLQDDGASWRNELAIFFPKLLNCINETRYELNGKLDDLVTYWMDSRQAKICLQENYTAMLNEINGVITDTILQVQTLISDQLQHKMKQIQSTMSYGININRSVLKKIKFEPTTKLSISFPQRSTFDNIVRKGRTISTTSMGCGAAGSIIGGVLGGIVGLFTAGPAGMLAIAKAGMAIGGGAGSMIGSAKGVVDTLGSYDNMDAAVVRKTMTHYCADSVTRAYSIINTSLTQLQIETKASFEMQLKKESMEINDCIAQIRKNLTIERTEIPRKQAELKAKAEALNKQILAIQQVGAMAVKMNAAVPVCRAPVPERVPERVPRMEPEKIQSVPAEPPVQKERRPEAVLSDNPPAEKPHVLQRESCQDSDLYDFL